MTHTQPPARYATLYRALIDEAAAGGGILMGKLVAATGMALHAREKAARDLRERDALAASIKLLQSKQTELRTQYPKALLAAFSSPERAARIVPLVATELHFDQLELMDEWQVQESVTLARAQQVALLAADASLAELNTLISTALGLATVRPERNPLRPEVYVNALKDVLEQMQVAPAIRLDWMAVMSATLGPELRDLYLNFSARLIGEGVAAAGYAVVQTPSSAAVRALQGDMRPSQPVAANRTSRPLAAEGAGQGAFFTLDKLRSLLAGELGQDAPHGSHLESFARQFSREFEGGPGAAEVPVSDFAATVPAAFEALAEMQQVDQVVQRLEQRRRMAPSEAIAGDTSIDAVRQSLRRSAGGVAQALSLEVVELMVDNIAMDPRLLEPVQRLIRNLEPAMLRLALVDPRFFSDKGHPARALLQEITHRSLAYGSVQARGFPDFVRELEEALAVLASATLENSEPFEQVLGRLRAAWSRAETVKARDREAAVKALQHAEQRNILAEKIAREIDSHPDGARVPPVVIDFLCGPWAQVVAQARIAGGAGSSAADKYQALISALLWSTHPELTRKNIAKLTRLVPLLLGTLRDGLETIQYPSVKTSVFLEALMGFHQMAFKAAQRPAEVPVAPMLDAVASPRSHRVESGDPWVAPEEAKASNFIELPDASEQEVSPSVVPAERPVSAEAATAVDAVASQVPQGAASDLPLGSWVELLANDQWVRTQLIWASPHGTLFLFTSVLGASQSMTRRSLDKLVAAGSLRIISGQPVVDGALDAVAQIAMRNSMDNAP